MVPKICSPLQGVLPCETSHAATCTAMCTIQTKILQNHNPKTIKHKLGLTKVLCEASLPPKLLSQMLARQVGAGVSRNSTGAIVNWLPYVFIRLSWQTATGSILQLRFDNADPILKKPVMESRSHTLNLRFSNQNFCTTVFPEASRHHDTRC